jgi:hypothetical protein
MRPRIGWFLPTIAGIATAVALLAGKNLSVAVPAAAVAVAAAALLILSAWTERARASAPPPTVPPGDADRIRRAFRSGRIGREELVATLHRLELRFIDPGLPPLSVKQLERIVEMSPDEFLRYVRNRIARLEAAR